MGTRVPRTIFEYPGFGLDFGVECRACGRVAVYLPLDVWKWFQARGLSTTLPIRRHPFRCRCGSRNVAIISVPLTARPASMPERPVHLTPIYTRQR